SARTPGSERAPLPPSRAVAPTTLAPTAAPSAPSASPSPPVGFTVHSTCSGRDCAVTVREGPSTVSKNVGSLSWGQGVQVNCSTHGESIEDTDTRQRSDVWYRLADTAGYVSAVY